MWMALKYARLRGGDRNALPEITNAPAATDDARSIFQKAFSNPKSPFDGFATQKQRPDEVKELRRFVPY